MVSHIYRLEETLREAEQAKGRLSDLMNSSCFHTLPREEQCACHDQLISCLRFIAAIKRQIYFHN